MKHFKASLNRNFSPLLFREFGTLTEIIVQKLCPLYKDNSFLNMLDNAHFATHMHMFDATVPVGLTSSLTRGKLWLLLFANFRYFYCTTHITTINCRLIYVYCKHC